jgi:hypothetical protein
VNIGLAVKIAFLSPELAPMSLGLPYAHVANALHFAETDGLSRAADLLERAFGRSNPS